MTVARLTSWLPSWARTTLRVLYSSDGRHDWRHERRRRRSGEPPLPPGPIRTVMVICYGNICRSPFAGAELAVRCPGLEIRSAGLEARDGKPPEPPALRVAREMGLDLVAHAAHRLDAEDIEWADLIIAMQGRHVACIQQRWPGGEAGVRLLGDFLPGPPHAIEDPWGREDDVFRSVFDRIVRANERLAELLREEARDSDR